MDETYHLPLAPLTTIHPALSEVLRLQGKTIEDVRTTDALSLARQLNRLVREIEEYKRDLIIHLTPQPYDIRITSEVISTFIPALDDSLGGGIPRGRITEIFGESGAGKSHLVTALAVASVKANLKVAVICTERFLETKRLKVIGGENVLEKIDYIYCSDMEAFDHVVFTQLPVLLSKGGYGMVIIDSISHHFRLEAPPTLSDILEDKIDAVEKTLNDTEKAKVNAVRFKIPFLTNSYRSRKDKERYMFGLFRQLAQLSTQHNLATVVTNQVSDSLNLPVDSAKFQGADDPLNYDFVAGIALGWEMSTLQEFNKIPVEVTKDVYAMESYRRRVAANGPHWLLWTGTRIAVKKSYGMEDGEWVVRRWWQVVYSTENLNPGAQIGFEITGDGINVIGED